MISLRYKRHTHTPSAAQPSPTVVYIRQKKFAFLLRHSVLLFLFSFAGARFMSDTQYDDKIIIIWVWPHQDGEREAHKRVGSWRWRNYAQWTAVFGGRKYIESEVNLYRLTLSIFNSIFVRWTKRKIEKIWRANCIWIDLRWMKYAAAKGRWLDHSTNLFPDDGDSGI